MADKKPLTGWDKVGAAARKRAAVSSFTGRKPLSPKVLEFLRGGVVGDEPIAKPNDWIGLRHTKKELMTDFE